MTTPVAERLNRYLARRGLASRRGADALIAAGRVRVNGASAVVGTVVDPRADRISLDGRSVAGETRTVTMVLNKPVGVVSTVSDPQRRQTVMNLVPAIPGLVPVGRLDADSAGLLLLTTDGELAHRVAHPRYAIHKRYRVVARDTVSERQMRLLEAGVELDDGRARALNAELRSPRTLELEMGEGRKREVRRMCAAVGIEVVSLTRTAIGPLRLGRLRAGAQRRLTGAEEAKLYASVGLPTEAG